MNKIYIGLFPEIEIPRDGIFINDEIPILPDWKRAKIFNPNEHSFNLLDDMDYLKACAIIDALLAIFPAGENTLTKEGVPEVLLTALQNNPKNLETLLPDTSKDPSYIFAQRMIRRLLLSPTLNRVLNTKKSFKFSPHSITLARINRAELGTFDAKALTFFLMSFNKGQITHPNFGVFHHNAHTSLIDQNRLIGHTQTLSQLTPALQQSVLLIKDKVFCGTTYKDAVTLAEYHCKFPPHTDGYDTFIKQTMGLTNIPHLA